MPCPTESAYVGVACTVDESIRPDKPHHAVGFLVGLRHSRTVLDYCCGPRCSVRATEVRSGRRHAQQPRSARCAQHGNGVGPAHHARRPGGRLSLPRRDLHRCGPRLLLRPGFVGAGGRADRARSHRRCRGHADPGVHRVVGSEDRGVAATGDRRGQRSGGGRRVRACGGVRYAHRRRRRRMGSCCRAPERSRR
jgi:hypothetical protein